MSLVAYLAAHGITPDSPIADIIDVVSDFYEARNPNIDADIAHNEAAVFAERWAR